VDYPAWREFWSIACMSERAQKRHGGVNGTARSSFAERAQRNRRGILWAMALTMAAAVLLIMHFSR
jgi:hypothetical protein